MDRVEFSAFRGLSGAVYEWSRNDPWLVVCLRVPVRSVLLFEALKLDGGERGCKIVERNCLKDRAIWIVREFVSRIWYVDFPNTSNHPIYILHHLLTLFLHSVFPVGRRGGEGLNSIDKSTYRFTQYAFPRIPRNKERTNEIEGRRGEQEHRLIRQSCRFKINYPSR